MRLRLTRELLQQHVQALDLRHEHRRAQHRAHVELLLGVEACSRSPASSMPMTLSRLSFVHTGSASGPFPSRTGMNAAELLRHVDRVHLRARGTITSRTCRARTPGSTPSIIDSESASSRLRACASWRTSRSSSRDSGSCEMKSVKSFEKRAFSFRRFVGMAVSTWDRVRSAAERPGVPGRGLRKVTYTKEKCGLRGAARTPQPC